VEPSAALAGRLERYLGRLAARDMVLDHDTARRGLLEVVGKDLIMWEVQDRFFDRA
jgi:hypothetical protein